MKTRLLLFLISSLPYCLHAQNCPAADDCSNDLTPSPHTIKSKNKILYGRQSGMPASFSDVHYKKGCGSTPSNTTCDCDPTDLFYKVFYPDDIDYTNCALPAVIMFHGGGFRDCSGVADNPLDDEQKGDDVITICQEFARKGFVAFDVEYRRGNYTDNDWVTAQSLLAGYRGVQDGMGAIRCIIQRQQYQNNHTQTDPYKIDVNTIFLGGNSAGSIIALNCAYYYRQSKIDSIMPGVATALNSSINPDYYDPDVNNSSYNYDSTFDYRPSIKGVLNDWGLAYIHKGYVNNPGVFFLSNDGYNPPIVSFYGMEDEYLPPGYVPQFYAPVNAKYKINNVPTNISIHTETNCLGACPSTGKTYTLNPDPNGGVDVRSAGSERIFNILSSKGIATLLYRDCQMSHGLDANGSNYASEFGTGATTRADTYKYIAARAANFFQVVLQYGPANTYTGVIKFTECEDKRHLCARGNTNGCSNGNNCDAALEEEVF